MRLVGDLLPPTTQDEWETGIMRAQALYHELGITAWQDARIDDPTQLAAYRAVAGRGDLTMRVEGNLLWDRARGVEQIDELLEKRAQGQVGRLRIRGGKIFADGVLENFTGALLEPYVDTDNHGMSMLTREELERAVVALDANGFQVHVHTIGDLAVRDALDAVEAAARANGRRDARHHFAHLQLVHPDDLPRFAELGVVANVSPLWACSSGYVDELTVPFIGPERSARMYPFGSLLRAGARLAFGSDWSVSTPDPLPQLEVAVTRISPETRDQEPLVAQEAIDLPTALRTFTAGSAYVNFLDAETGTLEPGKLADLVVLDRDILDPGAGPIGDARVLLTLSEGGGGLRRSRTRLVALSGRAARPEAQGLLLAQEPVREERLHDPIGASLVPRDDLLGNERPDGPLESGLRGEVVPLRVLRGVERARGLLRPARA